MLWICVNFEGSQGVLSEDFERIVLINSAIKSSYLLPEGSVIP